MANQDVRVSALQSASTLSTDDLALATVVDELSETGYTSKKITEGAKASQYLEAFTFANLNTTAKTIVGAINEAATTGAGDYPIHINNTTITETAGEVLDAMADGLRPYVILTNNSQSNYTFTYGLAAVWNPDATTETLIFGCPITGAVRTIHVYINPTTRTYSSSISIIDYNIPQINDSSTSSSSVWSSQKTASELAGKAEIDDTAVSSSTAWSSERIVSLLPTESASGAVANFETPLTLPLVSHNVTIEPVQEGTNPSPVNPCPISGRSAVTISHSGADTSDPTTYTRTFLDSNGDPVTVYGGSENLKTGEGVITHALYDYTNKGTAWYSGAPNASGFIRFVRSLPDKKNGVALLCDKFKARSSVVPGDSTEEGISGNSANDNIYIAVSTSRLTGDLTTSAGRAKAFNDWIDTNGLTICYELATPQTFHTDPLTLETLKGVNNIWADTGDTSVEFKQDIQTYIDSRLSSGTRSLSLAKPVETEEAKQEEQEGDENVNR